MNTAPVPPGPPPRVIAGRFDAYEDHFIFPRGPAPRRPEARRGAMKIAVIVAELRARYSSSIPRVIACSPCTAPAMSTRRGRAPPHP